MTAITPIRMPKWGLSMQEGTVVHWRKEEGAAVAEGEELVDIETPKITNVFEAPRAGLLRRIVAREGETLPVGALIAVLADESVETGAIDAFVREFQATFVPGEEGEGEGGMTLSTVEVDGRAIRAGRAGEGDKLPVVLLHGFSADLNNWLFTVPALTPLGPVIALDLPGHGASTKDVSDGSLASLANAVRSTLMAIDVTHFHLAGHSLGGAVAARLAADSPAAIASLTLIAPASLPGVTVSEEFINGMVTARRAREVKRLLEMLFADPALVTGEMVDAMLRYKRLDGVDEALARLAQRLLAPEDAAELAARLERIPSALLVLSRGDRIVSAPDPAKLPQTFKTVWIDGAGHMPHLEKAAEVNAILSALRA